MTPTGAALFVVFLAFVFAVGFGVGQWAFTPSTSTTRCLERMRVIFPDQPLIVHKMACGIGELP